ncbi:aKG-HExxH-type peptide beta-hydroxylase [Bradyrhizobium brasilense]|uniref:aKG-HExxH-type peptide beta-hydroxylase n=1 Tax=Bradyrhizobium brasilense TaxID=1419277 RepID=UPI001E365F4B|nr:HEXXH motif-containing putative peptide modification protein [Bradyrhizobium brasilense]
MADVQTINLSFCSGPPLGAGVEVKRTVAAELLAVLIELSVSRLTATLSGILTRNAASLIECADWDIFLGRWHKEGLADAPDRLHVAVLECLLNHAGALDEFDLEHEFAVPTFLTIGDHLLCASGRCFVTWKPPRLTLSTVELQATFAIGSTITLTSRSRLGMLLSYQHCADFLTLRWEGKSPQCPAERPVLDSLEAINRAQALFVHCNEGYREWVGSAIKRIHLIPRLSEEFNSGSDRFEIGTISLSENATPAQIAESLVHEASHQLFYFAKAIGPLVTDNEMRLYSPLKREKRSVENVLLAWHAMANVVAFLGPLADQPVFTRELAAGLEAAASDLRVLDQQLSSGPYLTPLGWKIFDPVRAKAFAFAG